MTDDRVATLVDTPAGTLEFQDYFVGRRQSDDVLGVTFAGIEQATAHPDALAAIREADAVVIAPSNPIVSRSDPGHPGMREALADTPAPIVAVSPIVGGRALKARRRRCWRRSATRSRRSVCAALRRFDRRAGDRRCRPRARAGH